MRSKATPSKQFAVCTDNGGYPASLEIGKLYPVIPNAESAKHGYIRVIDESGEDYLYPANYFMMVELPSEVQRVLLEP